MPLLLTACPSFAPRWVEHRAEWGEDEPLLYIDLGVFADHLVALLQRGETGEFPAVFDAVERLHADGNAYVREAATIGLLEGIQNVALNKGLDPDAFEPFLQMHSAHWWRRLNDFWSGKTPHV